MADQEITDLSSASAFDGTESFHVVQSGNSRQGLLSGVLSYIAAASKSLTNTTFDANGTGNSISNIETEDIASGSKSGSDSTLITGTEGTNGNLSMWNADGDLVDASVAASAVVTASSTTTFTNKTFDANGTGNSLSNVETADIASGSKSGADATLITGTAGTSGDLAVWNSDGDLVDGPTPPSGDLVGTTDTQTLTNKTLTSPAITTPTLTGTPIEDVFAVTGTTPAISGSNGSIQTWTLTDASTPTDSLTAGEVIILMIDDGSANTVTWTSLVDVWKTGSGAAPTLATSGYTVIVLWKVGTTVYAATVGDEASA